MLTQPQIQRLAQRHGVGVQVQERDYIQHLLLFLLYSRSQTLIFKGGTALRIVYKGNRYSEDLDFNGPADVALLKAAWEEVLQGLEDFGVRAVVRNEHQSAGGYSFDVSYQGPLYDGRDRTKGKVAVDISLRQEKVDTARELITSEYDDLRAFVVTAISLEHLMAEKIRALLMRSKARDAYDIWFLLHGDVQLDRSLVQKKLKPFAVGLSKAAVDSALEKAQADWDRDLRPLLPQLIPWGDVAAQLATLLHALAAK